MDARHRTYDLQTHTFFYRGVLSRYQRNCVFIKRSMRSSPLKIESTVFHDLNRTIGETSVRVPRLHRGLVILEVLFCTYVARQLYSLTNCTNVPFKKRAIPPLRTPKDALVLFHSFNDENDFSTHSCMLFHETCFTKQNII